MSKIEILSFAETPKRGLKRAHSESTDLSRNASIDFDSEQSEPLQIVGDCEKYQLPFVFEGQEFKVPINGSMTFAQLQEIIFQVTGVSAKRQRILGFSQLQRDIAPDDKVYFLTRKKKKPIKVFGTKEDDMKMVSRIKTDDEVVDDFDLVDLKNMPAVDAFVSILRRKEKVSRTIEELSQTSNGVHILGSRRSGYPIIMIDLHKTIMFVKSSSPLDIIPRPFMHHFLARVYEMYDIGIWTSLRRTTAAALLKKLEMDKRSDYKICCVVDRILNFEISYETNARTFHHNVKPIEVLTKKFPSAFSLLNTIVIDDQSRQAILNPFNYMKVRPFRPTTAPSENDNDLLFLASFLREIAPYIRATARIADGKGTAEDKEEASKIIFERERNALSQSGHPMYYFEKQDKPKDLRSIPLRFWKQIAMMQIQGKVREGAA